MYKKYYSRFLEANQGKMHFACHSHHYWPDVTRLAQLQYWDDCSKYTDEKWGYFFSTALPSMEKLLRDNLSLESAQGGFSWASSTHDLMIRILSVFPSSKKIKVLTTDGEFHSFKRQARAWELDNRIELNVVNAEPIETFEVRFAEAASSYKPDLVFFSHVFFNSGLTVDLSKLMNLLPKDILTICDAYHAFMAIPTDLKSFANRPFIYLAGGYKYAQGGEGCCFAWFSDKVVGNPSVTGWFAGLQDLESSNKDISYPEGAARFAGSTMDFSALYRLHAALTLFKAEGISVHKIHSHVQACQKNFLRHFQQNPFEGIQYNQLIFSGWDRQAHFLTFDLQSSEQTKNIYLNLKNKNILTDYRGNRLRFGFGLYHDGNYEHLF